jgi:purine nucleosidase
LSIIDFLIGRPLALSEERAEHIGVVKGVPIFGLDALSSAAYRPEAAQAVSRPGRIMRATLERRREEGDSGDWRCTIHCRSRRSSITGFWTLRSTKSRLKRRASGQQATGRVIGEEMRLSRNKRFAWLVSLLFASATFAQQKRYVLIDQDAAGPGGTDMMSILVLLQAPGVQTLGITVVTGDAWRDEEVAHAVRLLELIGRTDIPVFPGAVFPLVRSQRETQLWEQQYGKVSYQGAWTPGPHRHGPFEVPPLREGNPATHALNEDAAHFLVRMVREHPHQVTIYEGGPMTNLALALTLDPQFATLSKGLVFMGGSFNPQTADPEFASDPRREFNLWFDPEAAHVVLRASWPSIVCTTVDVSVKARLTQQMLDQISKAPTPVAQYVAKYSEPARSYLWDELAAAAWLDPSLITRERQVYMDVNLDRGAGYGDTLSWPEQEKPSVELQLVHAQMDVDMARFGRMFVQLMTARGR